jgi:tetratricopeptide (TPR) repeat protein
MADVYEELKKLPESEALRKQLLERDSNKTIRSAELVAFYLRQDQLSKATPVVQEAIKRTSNAEQVFDAIDSSVNGDDENETDKGLLTRYEKLLLTFRREIANSKQCLRNLASVQTQLEKYEDAIKTTQQALSFNPEAVDYVSLAILQRLAKRPAEALITVESALKIDEKDSSAIFEKACDLAQLGRKKEAFETLKRAIEIDSDLVYNITDDGLKPLEELPEFKAMLEKMKKASESAGKP